MAGHITINGHTFSSVDQMPADVRRQYETAMRLLSKNAGAVAHASAGDVNISTTGSDAAHHTLRVSARPDRSQRQGIRRLGRCSA